MTADLLDILKDVLEQTHQRYVPVSDAQLWQRLEHWERYDQLPDEGPLRGDCDCFAMACRKALLARGIPSRLVMVGVHDPLGDHLILECGGYFLDNLKMHVTRWDESQYALLRISGYHPGDAWHAIDTSIKQGAS